MALAQPHSYCDGVRHPLMSTIDLIMTITHTLFASLWIGSVLFFIGAVLPTAAAGSVSVEMMSMLTTRLAWLTRISALVFVATGGHLAGTAYTAGSLFGTPRGQLVVAMVILWFVLTGLIEISVKRFDRVAQREGISSAVTETRGLFVVAAAVAVLLLIDAGLLTANVV